MPDNVNQSLPQITRRVLQTKKEGNGELDKLIADDQRIASLGRFVATLNPTDIGKFKTPSLRDVFLTGPYMHDGSIASLEQAIELELYVRGGATNYPIILTASERRDLLDFLRALTSPTANSISPLMTKNARD